MPVIVAMIAAIFLTLLHGTSHAKLIVVGPTGDVPRIADAARIAQDGDIVEIMPGEYRGDTAVWTQRQIEIRGRNPRPVIIADGKHAEGKGIWVIRNGDFKVTNLEFRGARVPHQNGAGIRFEGGKLRIAACAFLDNQNGILTSNAGDAELEIEDSEFGNAPRQEGSLPHLLYVGRIASVRMVGSRFHAGYRGHLIKSRARLTDLRYNLIDDGPNGQASYEVDLPNGGTATLVGNVIGQSASTQNQAIVAFGAEGAFWPENALILAHNTLVNASPRPANFVRAWEMNFPAGFRTDIYNNLAAGPGSFDGVSTTAQQGNHRVSIAALAGPQRLDFRLTAGASGNRNDGWIPTGGSRITPASEFTLPVGRVPLIAPPTWRPGAFQSLAGETVN